MRIGSLEVAFHRTVRVADGRTPSNLPPSLGTMKTYKVAEYEGKCPESWEKDAVFVALHDTEALWISFHSPHPVAILAGAGGLNALTGEKLGTKLAEGNYLVAPPQPWLDGWKSDDGCVYQFVASPYQGGKGITVAEQLIGEESKTGAIGLAVFEPKDTTLGIIHPKPAEGYGTSPYDSVDYQWGCVGAASAAPMASGGDVTLDSFDVEKFAAPSSVKEKLTAARSRRRARSLKPTSASLSTPRKTLDEMGIGKGGKIWQKVYPDPYGIDKWRESPVAAIAVYVVNAQAFQEITGEIVPAPVDHQSYKGAWFGLQDSQIADVAGTNKFTGLKNAFVGDVSNTKTKATKGE